MRSTPAITQIYATHESDELLASRKVGVHDHRLLVVCEHTALFDPRHQAVIGGAVPRAEPAFHLWADLPSEPIVNMCDASFHGQYEAVIRQK